MGSSSAVHIVTLITSIIGFISNFCVIISICHGRIRRTYPKYHRVITSFSVCMIFTAGFLVYYNLGQEAMGHSDYFMHELFAIGMSYSAVTSVMHWVCITVEVHRHTLHISRENSLVREATSLIFIVWVFSAVFAGTLMWIMDSTALVGVVSFFIFIVGLALFVFYITFIRRQMKRRNKIYSFIAANEAHMRQQKEDYLPTHYIFCFFVCISPYIIGGMYETISGIKLSESTSSVILFVYSLVLIMHPVVYVLRRIFSIT